MFQKFDPRVRLLWWVCISLLAMVFVTAEATAILIFFLYLSWKAARLEGRLVRFTLGLIPFLFFITIVSLFPTFEVERGMRMALRYYVLLSATTLILNTTGFGELTNALRNTRHHRLRFLDKPLDVFSLVFGLALMFLPVAGEEWENLKETQRVRGIDLGGKLQQVRRGLEMFKPLFLRTMDRLKDLCIAIVVYGYDPRQPRTLYRRLKLSPQDKKVAFGITAITMIGITLAFTLKV